MYFASLGLHFAASEYQVRIISGSEEGLSGWITANLLLRQLYVNNNPSETYGISDIGGKGTGNATACSLTVQDLFNKSSCSWSSCGWNDVYQPVPIPNTLRFIAMSGWYYTFNSLAPRVPVQQNDQNNYEFGSTNLAQIETAINMVCNEPWSSVFSPDKFRP
ncbi:unnamed protein product, partial [Rotaria sp. Silwood2]